MDVMKPGRGTPKGEAHVLWVGPPDPAQSLEDELEGNRRLHEVCQFIHSSFKEAGYIVEDRPLKLHCTVVNTVYRKRSPKVPEVVKGQVQEVENLTSKGTTVQSSSQNRSSRGKKSQDRIPFSFTAIRPSDAVSAVASSSTSNSLEGLRTEAVPETPAGKTGRGKSTDEVAVELGDYPILSLELCEMGSYDEKGAYKSVGGISLLPEDLGASS